METYFIIVSFIESYNISENIPKLVFPSFFSPSNFFFLILLIILINDCIDDTVDPAKIHYKYYFDWVSGPSLGKIGEGRDG